MVSSMSKVLNVLKNLRQRNTNLRCKEVLRMLELLGFKIRDGRRGGHKVVSHPGLEGFYGTNFNCGHGANSQIKPVYIRKLIGIVEDWQAELEQYN